MGNLTTFTNPSFGIWEVDGEDGFRRYARSAPKLKCGYVCKECSQNVLAYKKPEKCSDHD